MATLTTRLDDNLKRQAESVFNSLGLSMSAGINVYLKQVVKTNGIPFQLKADEPEEPKLMSAEELLNYADYIKAHPEERSGPMAWPEAKKYLESMLNDE
jgi:DNA-damage-inducible protein J